jgi:hypothetical protein
MLISNWRKCSLLTLYWALGQDAYPYSYHYILIVVLSGSVAHARFAVLSGQLTDETLREQIREAIRGYFEI